MNHKLISFLLVFLCMGLFVFFIKKNKTYIEVPHSVEKPTNDKKEEGFSGAGKSLDAWSMARSYPSEKIRTRNLTEAMQIKKRLMPDGASTRSDWTPMGPQNFAGRILTITVDPNNPETLYAGAASGGLWRSVNDGATWNYVPTGKPVLGVSSVVVDPNNSNTIYIGTGEVYGDFNTNDSIPNQGTGQGYTVRYRRGTYGVGILKSTDGGLTWDYSLDWSQANELKGVNVMRISPFNSNSIYAGTSEGLFHTTNAGQTWTNILNYPNVTDIAMHAVDDGTMLVAVGVFGSSGHGLYRSTDGSNFSPVSIPDFSGKVMLNFSGADQNVAYASVGDNNASVGLFRSTDKGITWDLMSDYDYAKYQGWYAHDVAANPNDPNSILVAGIDIYRSTNHGVSLIPESDWLLWNLSAFPIEGPEQPPGDFIHADIHDVIYHPTIPNKVYVASDGGIFKSYNDGLDFISANTGLQTQQFYQKFSSSMQDENFAIGGLQDNATAVYRGDLAWERVIGGDGFGTAIDPKDDNNVWGSLYYMRLFYSKNKAVNFSANSGGLSQCNGVDPPNCFCNFSAPIAFAPSSKTLRIYAASNVVYRIDNGSERTPTNNGIPLDGNNPINALGVSAQNSNLVFAGTAPIYHTPAKLFRTENGGEDWTEVTGNLPDRFPMEITVDPCDDNIVYIVFGGYDLDSHVFRSNDKGASWFSIGDDLPDLPTNTIFVDPENTNHLYIGNDAGVFASTDGGQTWQTFSTGLPDAIIAMSISYTAASRKVRVATHGNGAYEADMLFEQEPFSSTPENLGEWYDDDFNLKIVDAPSACIYDFCFYNINDFDGTEWRSNNTRGFLYEEFSTFNINPNWTVGEGIWSIDNGVLNQGHQLKSNTQIDINLNQNDSTNYMYEWKMKLSGDPLNKRGGIHIFADDLSQDFRGNSYLIYFLENKNDVKIYKTAADGSYDQLKTENFDIPFDEFFNCRVVYEPSTGHIRVWVNDEVAAYVTDESPLLYGNGISLRTGESYAWFDDLVVSKSRTCSGENTVVVSPNGDCRFNSPNDSTFVCGIDAVSFSSIRGWNEVHEKVKIGEHLINLNGKILNENSEEVKDVNVLLSGVSNNSDITDTNGEFQFQLLSSNNGVEIRPEKNDDHRNGVSTFDLVLIRRHILGLQPLDSPYKIIAADANHDEKITTFDIVQLTRLILELITELPGNSSWRFVDGTYNFTDPTMPLLENFPDSVYLNMVSEDRNDLDFVAIKVGDVNGDAMLLNGDGQADLRTDKYVYLMLENKKLKVGEEVSIPFFAKDFKNINGYQLVLEFDPMVLELKESIKNKLNDFAKEEFGATHKNDGIILMNWLANETTTLKDGSPLFNLVFSIKKETTLKRALQITDQFFLSEAYDINDEFLKIGLKFFDEKSDQIFNLSNYPNPFIDQTKFSFIASRKMDATIQFYDVSGRMLKSVKQSFSEGENNLSIDFSNINYKGIVFYKIKSENGEWSGKLIKN